MRKKNWPYRGKSVFLHFEKIHHMTSKDVKKEYEAPVLTVVTFQVEQGYANSTKSLGLSTGHGKKTLESRTDGGNWGGSDDDSWF